MRTQRMVLMVVTLLCAAGGLLLLPAAEAEGFTTVRPGGRAGNWEFFLPITYIEGSTITGQGGSSADLSSDYGFGFGLGYNLNDNFAISGAWTWSQQPYDATIVSGTTGTTDHRVGEIDSTTLAINAIYYVSNKEFTPFITAGVGVTVVDTNVPTGTSDYYCWWDPYWGYICNTYTPTKNENDISYNLGIGVRWDASYSFALRAGYYKMWIDYENAAGKTPEFDLWRFELLFRL